MQPSKQPANPRSKHRRTEESERGRAATPVYVSTGTLPSSADVHAAVSEAHARYASDPRGRVSNVYPALAAVRADLFGICVAGVRGNLYAAGDTDFEFAIMSVSKPFVFALVCEAVGADTARERLGVNGTGLPFDSLAAIEASADGRTNPMVNSDAIAATSLVPGSTSAAKWRAIQIGKPRRPPSLARMQRKSFRPPRPKRKRILRRARFTCSATTDARSGERTGAAVARADVRGKLMSSTN